MKPSIVKVTLSFRNDPRIGTHEAEPYRLEKLVGAVTIPWQTKPKEVTFRVGDYLTEKVAAELANTRGYEVAVVPRKD